VEVGGHWGEHRLKEYWTTCMIQYEYSTITTEK
jgi:hypothetical protein